MICGTKVIVHTGKGSCINNKVGTILKEEPFLNGIAYRIRYEWPVIYPSGNIVEEDIVFDYEVSEVV